MGRGRRESARGTPGRKKNWKNYNLSLKTAKEYAAFAAKVAEREVGENTVEQLMQIYVEAAKEAGKRRAQMRVYYDGWSLPC